MSTLTRRTFLGASSAAAASLALGARRSLAASANSEVTMGFIGMGGRGNLVMSQFLQQPGVRVGAVCDADAARLGKVAQDHSAALATQDLRRVIDDPAIDAVMITTPNHWHCLAAIWAVQAGKDVYVEKPLGHNVWEGRQLVNAAARHNRIVQIGTQQRSDPVQAEIKAFLHDDQKLGKPLYVQACRYGVRGPIGKRAEPLTPPRSLDYNLWLGPAADEPIYRERFHYDWHWDYNAGNGEMGNWSPHIVDDVRNVALQDDVTLPTSVFAAGGRIAWDDAGESPNVHLASFQTATLPVFLGLSNLHDKPGSDALSYKGVGSGYVVHCEGGYYAGGRGGGKAFDADGKQLKQFRGDSGAGHVANFLKALRDRDATILNAPVETGHHSTNWCHLANIAYQTGQTGSADLAQGAADGHPGWEKLLETMQNHLASYDTKLTSEAIKMSPVLMIDPEAERFTGAGSEAANKLLRRDGRPGFEVPEIA